MTRVQTFMTSNILRRGLAALMIYFTALMQTAWGHDSQAHVNPVIHVEVLEARTLLASNPTMKVLDVRTKGEYKRGHIEGAIRNNYFSTKFKKRLRALNRDTPYMVHCKSGHRSERVVKIMRKEGFTNIYHLDGGYDAWKKLTPADQKNNKER